MNVKLKTLGQFRDYIDDLISKYGGELLVTMMVPKFEPSDGKMYELLVAPDISVTEIVNDADEKRKCVVVHEQGIMV